jgi:hypothetical protein
MSDFRINQITNQAGTAGPQIAGITTFSSTSGLVMPSGNTLKRNIIENIVQNGLVFYLDAGNDLSYSGTGTLWRDLSYYTNNATLINMDSSNYTTSNGGYFTFNGTDEYVIATRPPTILTDGDMSVCMFARWNTKNSDSTADIQVLLDNNHSGSRGFVIQDRPDLQGDPLTASGNLTSTFKVGDGNWHFIGITIQGSIKSKMYIDGFLNTTGSGGGILTVQPNITLGYWTSFAGGRYLNGNIANIMIYDRVLMDTEISQNFNTFRRRFGI